MTGPASTPRRPARPRGDDTVRSDAPAYARIPEWVLLHPDLDGNAIRLYAVLDRYAGQDEDCWPGRRALAAQLGCSKDTVDRALKKLVAASAVTVTERWDAAGDQTSNAYTVHFFGPEGVAARVPGGGRKSAATGGQQSDRGGRTDAATGGRKSAALSRTILNEEPPNPPPAGGDATADLTSYPDLDDSPEADAAWRAANPPLCGRHRDAPGANCRACGTTPRQLEAAAARRAGKQRRLDDAEAIARDRAEREAAQAAGRSPDVCALLADTRAHLATVRATPTTSRSAR